MKKRYIETIIKDLAFKNNKMAFISGPRQSGKTTLSKMLTKIKKEKHSYFNWDDPNFRRQWVKNPSLLLKNKEIVIFDEIHKARKWKQNLKGIYDTLDKKCHIIVTGSARLNIYKKGGDSLLGRYFSFRLHPFSLGELLNNKNHSPEKTMKNIFDKDTKKEENKKEDILKKLIKFGGFPEPYLKGSNKFLNLWQKGRLEKIIREDLRDLSNIKELSQVEVLTSILPEKISNPISIQSLKEDLETSHETVERYIKYLKELYYIYEIKPYSKSIPRSIKKQGKLYLWDWSEVIEEGAKFENLVASHLLKACDFWNDSGEGTFKLFYLKNKQGKELDFLITKDKNPWLVVECKNSKKNTSKNFDIFLKYINCTYAIQIINKPGLWEKTETKNTKLLTASASKILSHLP